ncbi:hypothetical protein [Staphylococcus capitis]|mgnify:FL=1|jgi:hypothetical protein|uniref:hypothetical protein n=1 Tax=Staphylococcus capitis TaxID=29388 RepID=UPI0001EF4E60|nr:hypothetical protein [Staphylococcus capitis]EFS17881.1 putative DNA double-strand break repair Rad50 ATPase [Staphylococcus capitis C87]QKH90789.1 hypothetical protein FOC61_05255 [Staphylococcus capitis]
MAEVKLSQESYDELLEDIKVLKEQENKHYEIIAELRNENTSLKTEKEVVYNTCKEWIKDYEELYEDYTKLTNKVVALDKIKEFINAEFKEYEGLAITDLYDGGILYAIEKVADIIYENEEEQ